MKDLKAKIAGSQAQIKEERGSTKALAVFGKSKSFSGSSRGLVKTAAKADRLRWAASTNMQTSLNA